MLKKKQPARKHSKLMSEPRAGLIIRLCTVLRRASAEKEWTAFRTAIIRAAFGGQHQDYRETGNPLHLLNGFVTARRAGVPIPEWVLQPLTAAIEMFLGDKGKITLEEALRPDLVKQGQRKMWTENENHEKDARYKWLFDRELEKGLPLKSDKPGEPSAVKAVAALLERDADKDEALLKTYHERLKKHSSRLSR